MFSPLLMCPYNILYIQSCLRGRFFIFIRTVVHMSFIFMKSKCTESNFSILCQTVENNIVLYIVRGDIFCGSVVRIFNLKCCKTDNYCTVAVEKILTFWRRDECTQYTYIPVWVRYIHDTTRHRDRVKFYANKKTA